MSVIVKQRRRWTFQWREIAQHPESGRSRASLSVAGKGNNTGVRIYSFNFNTSPQMSYGVLECGVTFQNYTPMILS